MFLARANLGMSSVLLAHANSRLLSSILEAENRHRLRIEMRFTSCSCCDYEMSGLGEAVGCSDCQNTYNTYHLLVCALFGDGITVTYFRGLAPPLSVLSLIGAPARKKRSKVSADALRASVASKIL